METDARLNSDDRQNPGTKHDRRDPPPVTYVLIGALLLAFIVGAIGSFVAINLFARQQDAIRGGCVRNQTERERANIHAANIYIVESTAAKSTQDEDARAIYELGAAATYYSPPADCDKAVADPGHYKPPQLEAFDHLPDEYPHEILNAARQGIPQPTPS